MWIGLFMDLVMYPILLVCYFMGKNYQRKEKGLCFAVTLPGERMQDARVQAVGEAYRKQMRRSLIFLMIFPLPFLFTGYFSINFLAWTIWFVLMFVLLMLPWAGAHKKLSALKRDQGWQRELPEGTDTEDAYWKWGLYYYNPDKTVSSVETRVGVGTTLNMARPWAKLLGILSLLVFAVMPVFGGYCVAEEFTPLFLTVQKECVEAGQFRDTYRIPVKSIESMELLEELPKMSKSSGTGLDNLRKGTYYIRNQGKCKVLHHPKNQKFIYIKTADQTYYLSGETDEETVQVYQEISGLQEE